MKVFTPQKPVILVIADSPSTLASIAGPLQGKYSVLTASQGATGLRLVNERAPSLILLDVLDGFDVCRELKSNPKSRAIPVIFVTGETEAGKKDLAMELGAVDFITRPVSRRILLSRVQAHFVTAREPGTLRANSETLEFAAASHRRELLSQLGALTVALGCLAEPHGADIGNHLERTRRYVRALAEHLRSHPRFAPFLGADMISNLYLCAPLHDIGKMGHAEPTEPGESAPDSLSLARQQAHAQRGRDAIETGQLAQKYPMELLEITKQLVYSHHERWDGSGYPLGLSGEQIPIPARLMALADAYDDLVIHGTKQAALSRADAATEILRERGRRFDPDIVDAFIALQADFESIATHFSGAAALASEPARGT